MRVSDVLGFYLTDSACSRWWRCCWICHRPWSYHSILDQSIDFHFIDRLIVDIRKDFDVVGGYAGRLVRHLMFKRFSVTEINFEYLFRFVSFRHRSMERLLNSRHSCQGCVWKCKWMDIWCIWAPKKDGKTSVLFLCWSWESFLC